MKTSKAYAVLAGLAVQLIGLVQFGPLWLGIAIAAAVAQDWYVCAGAAIVSMLVPVAVAFARREHAPRPGSWGSGADIVRGHLPAIFAWMETPDEPLPGGFYEPRVHRRYKALGWYACAVLWLWDNRAAAMGHALGTTWASTLWHRSIPLGPIKLNVGWERAYASPAKGVDAFPANTYEQRLDAANSYVAVPTFSLRWNRQD